MSTGAPPRERPPGAAARAATAAPTPRRREARPGPPAAVLLVAALLVTVLLSLLLGARTVPLPAVLDVLTGSGMGADAVVVRDLRLPRTAVGVLVGAALGAAGALMQGLTRNPLADPGLLGINAGAALGFVLAVAVLDRTSLLGGVGPALLGAAVAFAAVQVLGTSGRAAPTPARLALAGVAVASLLGALTSAVVVLDRGTLETYRFWAVGSLSGRSASTAVELLPFVAVGLLLALAAARSLDATALGEDTAAALGVRVGRLRAVVALTVVLLAGAATAAAGPVAFVGLVVPHAVRAWSGSGHRRLVLHSALGGAVLVLLADVAGRLVVRPGEVPVGVAVAAVGGPAFVLLVRRSSRGRA